MFVATLGKSFFYPNETVVRVVKDTRSDGATTVAGGDMAWTCYRHPGNAIWIQFNAWFKKSKKVVLTLSVKGRSRCTPLRWRSRPTALLAAPSVVPPVCKDGQSWCNLPISSLRNRGHRRNLRRCFDNSSLSRSVREQSSSANRVSCFDTSSKNDVLVFKIKKKLTTIQVKRDMTPRDSYLEISDDTTMTLNWLFTVWQVRWLKSKEKPQKCNG